MVDTIVAPGSVGDLGRGLGDGGSVAHVWYDVTLLSGDVPSVDSFRLNAEYAVRDADLNLQSVQAGRERCRQREVQVEVCGIRSIGTVRTACVVREPC